MIDPSHIICGAAIAMQILYQTMKNGCFIGILLNFSVFVWTAFKSMRP